MNLIDKIKAYLIKRAAWVHSHEIYVKASERGYTTESIKRALDTIHRTAPFAIMNVKGDDYRTLEQMGVTSGGYYYTAHPMTPEELSRNQTALDAFDEL